MTTAAVRTIERIDVERIEARRYPRYGVVMPVRMRPDGWDHAVVVFSSDVSLGGLFLRTRELLPVGSRLTVVMGLGEEQPLELRAEVRHRAVPGHRAAAGIGVQFLELSARDAARLSDLVARVAGERQRPVVPVFRAAGAEPPAAAPAGAAGLSAEQLFDDLPPAEPAAAPLDAAEFDAPEPGRVLVLRSPELDHPVQADAALRRALGRAQAARAAGALDRAAEHYEDALLEDPTSAEARAGLRAVRRARPGARALLRRLFRGA